MKMKIKIMKTLLSVAVLTAITSSASAAPIGTAAGTEVNNTASISYSVGNQAQTPIESSKDGNTNPGVGNGEATTFVVDKKIDLLVTGATTTNVVPGQTATNAANNNELSYTLLNEGNSTENFALTASDALIAAVAGTDDFNSSNCTVISPASPVELDSGEQVDVKVQCDIPVSSATVTNGAKSLVDLLATATGVTASNGTDTVGCTTGTVAAGNCTVDVVFADGTGTGTDAADRNAKHSATSTYLINTADLTVKKTEAVTAMAINGSDDPADTNFHIPGSTIVYTIVVTNDTTDGTPDAATATGIVLSDTVPTTMTVVGTPTVAITGGNGGAATMASGAGVSAVATNAFDLDAGETATLTITATVN